MNMGQNHRFVVWYEINTKYHSYNGLIIMDKKFSDNIMCIVSLKKFYHLKLFEKY